MNKYFFTIIDSDRQDIATFELARPTLDDAIQDLFTHLKIDHKYAEEYDEQFGISFEQLLDNNGLKIPQYGYITAITLLPNPIRIN